MKTFRLTIISATSTIYSGDAVYCGVVTPAGSLGIEAGHEPFLAALKEKSPVAWRDGAGKDNTISVDHGMLTFKKNACTIIVSQA